MLTHHADMTFPTLLLLVSTNNSGCLQQGSFITRGIHGLHLQGGFQCCILLLQFRHQFLQIIHRVFPATNSHVTPPQEVLSPGHLGQSTDKHDQILSTHRQTHTHHITPHTHVHMHARANTHTHHTHVRTHARTHTHTHTLEATEIQKIQRLQAQR